MEQGWIKLHRKLKNKEYYKKPYYLALWIHLLLKANHKKEKLMWNGEIIIIKNGQFLTGRKELSKETGIPETTIERALNYFEKNGHQIGQQKTTKYRIITILNWNTHQSTDIKTDNKRTTNGQQMDTNKNDKNDKNDKKLLLQSQAIVGKIDINKFIELFKEVNPSYKRLYAMKGQRAAIERLVKEYGEEKLRAMIEALPKVNKIAYMPATTTPYELEGNIGKIKARMEQEKSKVVNNKIASI